MRRERGEGSGNELRSLPEQSAAASQSFCTSYLSTPAATAAPWQKESNKYADWFEKKTWTSVWDTAVKTRLIISAVTMNADAGNCSDPHVWWTFVVKWPYSRLLQVLCRFRVHTQPALAVRPVDHNQGNVRPNLVTSSHRDVARQPCQGWSQMMFTRQHFDNWIHLARASTSEACLVQSDQMLFSALCCWWI